MVAARPTDPKSWDNFAAADQRWQDYLEGQKANAPQDYLKQKDRFQRALNFERNTATMLRIMHKIIDLLSEYGRRQRNK